MLRFKIDENLPVEVATLLTDAGHDALTVLDQSLGGRSDPEISDVCRVEQRIVFSLDLDFADIRSYPPASYSGIIVLRLTVANKTQILTAVSRLIPLLDEETIVGKLWIVDETRVRIRE